MSPGIIDTPTGSAAISGLQVGEEQVKLGVVDSIPNGSEGNSHEVAKAVLFLASYYSSFITGIELFVDGGSAQI